MTRTPLSEGAENELRRRMSEERPGVRLGDQLHGPWCELVHEENRWWEVYLRAVADPTCSPGIAADLADAAIAEAKKRGKL